MTLKRLTAMFRQERLDKDLRDELDFHVEMKTRELIQEGASPAEARREALRRFGNASSLKERTRDMDIIGWIESIVTDIRLAVRTLLRSRTATAVGVLTLGLGIAANTTIFALVNALLLQPLPYSDSNRLVIIGTVDPQGREDFANYTDMQDWRRQSKTLERITAYVPQSVNLTGEREPERLNGAFVSAGFFDLLGVQAAAGRTFRDGDDEPGAPPLAVAAYDLWQNRYGGSADFIGKKIILNGDVFTVAGVLPRDFHFAWSDSDVFIPFIYCPNYRAGKREASNAAVFAHVRKEYSLDQARSELTTIAGRLASQYPDTNRERGLRLKLFQDFLTNDTKSRLLLLWGAVTLVFLIACANLANISLARVLSRERELSIRTALGAGRLRLMRQMLLENLVIAVTGSALGLILGYWGFQLITTHRADLLPFANRPEIGPAAFAFGLGLGLIGALVCTAIPAIQVLRPGRAVTLNEGGRASTESRDRGWTRRLLVVVEVSLCLMLVAGAGLLVRVFTRITALEPGFATKNLLTLEYRVPRNKYPKPEQQWHFHQSVIERVRQIPGVRSASAVFALPFSGNFGTTTFLLPDRPQPARGSEPRSALNRAAPGWFETLRIPLLQGRYIDERDHAGAPKVVVISRTLAQQYWPGQDPIGRQIRLPDMQNAIATIVGVAGDIRHRHLEDRLQVQMYVPFAQFPHIFSTLIVETPGDPLAFTASVRRAVWSVDKDQPVWKVRSMDSMVERYVSQLMFLPAVLSGFSLFALLLAALGIYGVISYSTQKRTREIGLRLAVGAQPADVVRLILRDGVRMTVAGVVVGLAGALALAGLLRNIMFDLSPYDPWTLAASSLVLGAVAVAASYIPARRALRLDPIAALRHD